MSIKPKIIVVLGPTASGKSELSVQLAKKFDGEIISADSRQVYRGMDIGTGKVRRDRTFPVPKSKCKMQNAKFRDHFYSYGIRHHLIDVASPKRTFTVAQYQKLGKAAIKKVLSRGRLPIIVGGTGFYIDSLIYDYNLPKVLPNPKLRRELDKKSAGELFAKLKRLDPRRAKTIDRWNKRRLIRALEIVLTTGRPVPPPPQKIYSHILKNMRIDKSGVLKIGIKVNPNELKRRIHTRLLARLQMGMIGEVKKLRAQGLGWKKLDDFGLEYRFVSRYLRGLINKKEMIKLLEKEIGKYAKRQMTWFKRDKEIKWIESEKETVDMVKKLLKGR